jgi:uncharacterized integral membrane protein
VADDDRKWIGEDRSPAKRGDDHVVHLRFTPRRVVSVALIVVVVVLILQNSNSADVHLLFFTHSSPLWLVIGGTMVVSFLAGWLFGGHRARREDD